MIISRTPLRMSFTGGGSDLPAVYKKMGGAVLSTTIDKYVYVNVNKKFNDGVRVAYSVNEEVDCADNVKHPIVKNTLSHLKMKGGIEITTIADIPSKGTGLGSSSSFTVGLLHALNAYQGTYVTSEKLAEDSSHIEIGLCGEPIGKQDQYAAAFGGFNLIEFNQDDSVLVTPVVCKKDHVKKIEKNIIVFYTGITRSASPILKKQSDTFLQNPKHQSVMKKMIDLTYQLKKELEQNKIDSFGEILHENWELKKSLTDGISSTEIDTAYKKARQAGALGGKILGAGAGGFLMFYAPQEKHPFILEALSPLRHIPMEFEPLGSRIIFYH